MPNPRYRKGANFERVVRAQLEADGYYVLRSAGSKSQLDLVAFKGQTTLFIQCSVAKRPKSKTEQRALRDLAGEHGATAVLWTKAGPDFLEEAA